ncbi:DUF485 domain-containing protein [Brevibacillus borstelensis]|uniref:DUF485 domain-containing protein n=1 Tax=Brevibacillus borstelensis TaxID=45462 RepID=UPI0030BD8FAA
MGKTSPTAKAMSEKQTPVQYSSIIRSATFQELLRRKKAFIVPYSIFFFLFYFTLPIMTSYFQVLNKPAFGAITWAWVFAFCQFIMTWGLCIIYSKKSRQFDELVEKIKQETGGKGV